MRILWISPWFGNYRIPVYDNLNRLSGGNFYIICSQENTTDLVREKLKASLGDHAIIMSGEKRTTMGSEESDFANSALVIKRQPGLYKAVKAVKPDVVITGRALEAGLPLVFAMRCFIARNSACFTSVRHTWSEILRNGALGIAES